MKNKIKKSYAHVHQIEDVWIDCRIEEDIQSLDYFRLIVEKIENFNLANIPKNLEEDGDILDPMYKKNKVVRSPLPLIQWSQKENTSIRVRFQNILDNTNVWLTLHGVQLKPFETRSDDDIARPMGKTFELRTKNRQDPIAPKAPQVKICSG